MANGTEAVSGTPASNLQTYGSYVRNPDAHSVAGCDRYCSLVEPKDLDWSNQPYPSAPDVSPVPRFCDFRPSDTPGIVASRRKIDTLCSGDCADVDGIASHPRNRRSDRNALSYFRFPGLSCFLSRLAHITAGYSDSGGRPIAA